MLKLYRIVKVLTVLVALGTLGVQATRLCIDFRTTQQQAHDGAHRASRDVLKIICNWQVYEPVRPKLREAHRRGAKGEAWLPERLGFDWNYVYFYDFAADEIYCERRANPGAPVILGERLEDDPIWSDPIVRLIICFIAVCGAALAIARIFR